MNRGHAWQLACCTYCMHVAFFRYCENEVCSEDSDYNSHPSSHASSGIAGETRCEI